jgi:hypothetical protein
MGILVMLRNQGMSFQLKLGSMKEEIARAASIYVVAARGLHVGAYIVKLGAHVLLPTTKLRRIDCDEETLASTFFGMLDDSLCHSPILVDV